MNVRRPNQVIGITTTLLVPAEPLDLGTLFAWPGLEPGDGERGILQPVLTWGASCMPVHQPPAYTTWWISGEYVHMFSDNNSLPHGCFSGPIMTAEPGDFLKLTMTLNGNIWTQKILNQRNQEHVEYSIDLQGQKQNWAIFAIEKWYGSNSVSPIHFLDTTVIFAEPTGFNCKIFPHGTVRAYAEKIDEINGCYLSNITLGGEDTSLQ